MFVNLKRVSAPIGSAAFAKSAAQKALFYIQWKASFLKSNQTVIPFPQAKSGNIFTFPGNNFESNKTTLPFAVFKSVARAPQCLNFLCLSSYIFAS